MIAMPSQYTVHQQHRDFALLIASCVLFLGVTTIYSRLIYVLDGGKFATISVEGMCCELRTKPAIRELSRVRGVQGIEANYRKGSIRLELRRTLDTSPQSLWDAVAKASLRPVQLVVDDRTFDHRPLE